MRLLGDYMNTDEKGMPIIKNTSICFLVAEEDAEVVRDMICAEIFAYKNNRYCMLSIPVSTDGNMPVTHWFAADIVDQITLLEIENFLKVLTNIGILYEFAISADIFSFLSTKNLKLVDLRFWKTARQQVKSLRANKPNPKLFGKSQILKYL